MAKGKLILDAVFEDTFVLLAIHCSLEPYRLAYFINMYLKLKLKRIDDVEIYEKENVIDLPLFYFEDDVKDSEYFLVTNRYTVISSSEASQDLFGNSKEQAVKKALIKEYKNADFFLKIEDDCIESIPIKKLTRQLNDIKHIVTAYTIDTETLKQKERLVFK